MELDFYYKLDNVITSNLVISYYINHSVVLQTFIYMCTMWGISWVFETNGVIDELQV